MPASPSIIRAKLGNSRARAWIKRAIVFAATACGVYLVGSWAVRTLLPPTSLETNRIVLVAALDRSGEAAADGLDAQQIQKDIASPERLSQLSTELAIKDVSPGQIAEHLRVELRAPSQTQRMVITLAEPVGLTSAQAIALLNRLAENVAVTDLTRRMETAEEASRSARDATDEARRSSERALKQLDVEFDRALAAPSTTMIDSAPEAPTTDRSTTANANRVQIDELNRQIAMLRTRRATLVVQRRPSHPEVVELDDQISAIESQVAELSEAVPAAPGIVPNSSKPSLKSAVASRDLQARREDYERARSRYDQSVRAERATAAELVHCRDLAWRFTGPAKPIANQAMTARVPWPAVVSVLAALAGACAAYQVRSAPPVFSSVADLERDLAVPVLGVVSFKAGADMKRSGRLEPAGNRSRM